MQTFTCIWDIYKLYIYTHIYWVCDVFKCQWQIHGLDVHLYTIYQSYDLVMFGLYSPFLSSWIQDRCTGRDPPIWKYFLFWFCKCSIVVNMQCKEYVFFLYFNYRNIGYMWLGIKTINPQIPSILPRRDCTPLFWSSWIRHCLFCGLKEWKCMHAVLLHYSDSEKSAENWWNALKLITFLKKNIEGLKKVNAKIIKNNETENW